MEIAIPQLMIEEPPSQALPFSGADALDKPSLREVFAAEESRLLLFAHGLTGRWEAAQDLVQEAFLRLHAHWSEVAQPRAWLYRSVRNLALNHLRSRKKESGEEAPETPDERAAPDEHLARQEAAGAVRLLLAEMRDEDRRLLLLKYQEDLKYDQISQRTGLSVGNVGYKLHHLLKSLAENLRRLGVESPEG